MTDLYPKDKDSPDARPLLATLPVPVPPASSVVARGARFGLLVVVMFIVGIILGIMLLRSGIQAPLRLPLLATLLIMLGLSWLQIFWHELGHAAAAWLVRFRLLMLIVGPLRLRWTQGGLRLDRSHTARHYGGLVYAIPDENRDLRRRRFAIVAGGPLASLLLTVAAGAAYVALRERAPLAATLLFYMATLAGLTTLLTLIPHKTRGVRSDGGQMLHLLRGGPQVERELAAQLLSTALVGGVRPRDLDAELFALAFDTPNPEDASGVHYLAYWRDLDLGDVERAAAHLDTALAHRGSHMPLVQAAFAAEAAYLLARYRGDATTARAWLELAAGQGVDEPTIHRAQAAVLLAEGRPSEALSEADAGLRLSRHSIDAGGAMAEQEWLNDLRAAAEAAL